MRSGRRGRGPQALRERPSRLSEAGPRIDGRPGPAAFSGRCEHTRARGLAEAAGHCNMRRVYAMPRGRSAAKAPARSSPARSLPLSGLVGHRWLRMGFSGDTPRA